MNLSDAVIKDVCSGSSAQTRKSREIVLWLLINPFYITIKGKNVNTQLIKRQHEAMSDFLFCAPQWSDRLSYLYNGYFLDPCNYH